jgi:hypothetical protein
MAVKQRGKRTVKKGSKKSAKKSPKKSAKARNANKRPDPPRPDKLTGPIKYREPKGKPEDRPLERLHREYVLREKVAKRSPTATDAD